MEEIRASYFKFKQEKKNQLELDQDMAILELHVVCSWRGRWSHPANQ
jgi:hypothetical protein